MRRLLLCALIFVASATALPRAQQAPAASALEAETLQHFQALLRLDTSSPPGNEIRAVNYLKQVLDKEGIPYEVFAKDPQRPNLVVRIKGNGKKKPILVMGHTDVAWLQLNLEFYPQSARSYLLLSTVYGAKKDTPNAIKAAEKAVELDPQNAQAKAQLERLKKG